jgi:hypothetical protein
MDALPGAALQVFANLWDQHPEVAAGIYAAGAVAAAVPNCIPSFEQAKSWYQRPRLPTRSVAEPVHTTEDVLHMVHSIITEDLQPTVTITPSKEQTTSNVSTPAKSKNSPIIDNKSTRTPSKEKPTSNVLTSTRSKNSPIIDNKSIRTTSQVVVEHIPASSKTHKIEDGLSEQLLIQSTSKTVSTDSSPGSSTKTSTARDHKSAFTHYRQHAADRRTSTVRESKPAFTHYRQHAASSRIHDSPLIVNPQRSRWNDFRRAIHDRYVAQRAEQNPAKQAYYKSPFTLVDVIVGYVPSILFAICDSQHRDDSDREFFGFLVRAAYTIVISVFAYAGFRLPMLSYSECVTYTRCIGSMFHDVCQKMIAKPLGKQQHSHFIVDRALYAMLVGIALYFLPIVGHRIRRALQRERHEDRSQKPAIKLQLKEILLRCFIGLGVGVAVIWSSTHVQDFVIVFATIFTAYVLSIYGKLARNTIFTLLDLVVCGSYRSVIAARKWIRFYAIFAVVVYLLNHEQRLWLCPKRVSDGIAPPFSHIAVVTKLVGLSYVDTIVRVIISISRIFIEKLRVVKAWAQYKYGLIVSGRATVPWHPKTVGGCLRWMLATTVLGIRVTFGLIPAWVGHIFYGIVMLITLWLGMTFALIPLYLSLFMAIERAVQWWTVKLSETAAYTVKDPKPSTAASIKVLQKTIAKITDYTATSRDRITKSYTHTATSQKRATKSHIPTASGFIYTTRATISPVLKSIPMNLSIFHNTYIKPVVSYVGTSCSKNWCQARPWHWVWRATTILTVTILCTIGWILAAQAYPAHKTRSSVIFAISFISMYILGTNGVLACTQDYGVIFTTVLTIILLLRYPQATPVLFQASPDERPFNMPGGVETLDAALSDPTAANIPSSPDSVGSPKQESPKTGTPAHSEQASTPDLPRESERSSSGPAIDPWDEDLSGLPYEVDASSPQEQSPLVQAPAHAEQRIQEPSTQSQAQPQTPITDNPAHTHVPPSMWQQLTGWLREVKAAYAERDMVIEAARAAADQEHEDYMAGIEFWDGDDFPKNDGERPTAVSSRWSRRMNTEQQLQAAVEAEGDEAIMPAAASEAATESLSASPVHAPVAPVAPAAPAAPVSVDTSTPAATSHRTPLVRSSSLKTTTTPAVATPLTSATSLSSLFVPATTTTPSDVPKSAGNTAEPSTNNDVSISIPAIIINSPETEVEGEATPATNLPVGIAGPTPVCDRGVKSTNNALEGVPATVTVQDQQQDSSQDEDDDDSDFGGSDNDEGFYGDETATQRMTAPAQTTIPIHADNAAELEKVREDMWRQAEQNNATTSKDVASGGAPAPGISHGDDDNNNGDSEDHDGLRDTPMSGASKHDALEPKKPSSTEDVPMGGMDDDSTEATPDTGKPRSWAPFSSLPSSKTEPPMFTEDELNMQYALPAMYNRPVARPTNPNHVDSAEQWRNRLLGGPSTLTIMRREREAAARNANGDSGDPPSGPGGPSSGAGGGGGPPAPLDRSSGSGVGNLPSPSPSTGSAPMDGIEESSSSEINHHGESDSNSHDNNDGYTGNDQADTNENKGNDGNQHGNNGNDSDSDNDGDPPAPPGAPRITSVALTAPLVVDPTAITDEDGDTDMLNQADGKVDFKNSIDDATQQASIPTAGDVWGVDQYNGISTILDPFSDGAQYNETAMSNILADMAAYELQNGPIKTSPPMFESAQDPLIGDISDAILNDFVDAYAVPTTQPSGIFEGSFVSPPAASNPFSNETWGNEFGAALFEPLQDPVTGDEILGDFPRDLGDEYFLPTAQPSVTVQAPLGDSAHPNWGNEFGFTSQPEQDIAISPEELARSAAEKEYQENLEVARNDLASPPPDYGNDFNPGHYGLAEGYEGLTTGLTNVNLNADQTGNHNEAQETLPLGAPKWEHDFDKAPEKTADEYEHPDEFTLVRPRTRLVQLQDDRSIVGNPDYPGQRSAGKSLDKWTGRQGLVYREVPMDTYEMRGANHDDFKHAQELMPWFNPEAEGAELADDSSQLDPDDGSILSAEMTEDQLDELGAEVAKDNMDDKRSASKRPARDFSDDSDSEGPEITPDDATAQIDLSRAQGGTQKKGRFTGPVSFDVEGEEEEAQFEKTDLEKLRSLPIWAELNEAKVTSTGPFPVQSSPVTTSGLPTRPTAQGTLNRPPVPNPTPTLPSSPDTEPTPSNPYPKISVSSLPFNPYIPRPKVPGGSGYTCSPNILGRSTSATPSPSTPSFNPVTILQAQRNNAVPPTRRPEYQPMKLPGATSPGQGSLSMPPPSDTPTRPTAGLTAGNSPLALPTYNLVQPPASTASADSLASPSPYYPAQPAAGHTAGPVSKDLTQPTPLSELSVPQLPFPPASTIMSSHGTMNIDSEPPDDDDDDDDEE